MNSFESPPSVRSISPAAPDNALYESSYSKLMAELALSVPERSKISHSKGEKPSNMPNPLVLDYGQSSNPIPLEYFQQSDNSQVLEFDTFKLPSKQTDSKLEPDIESSNTPVIDTQNVRSSNTSPEHQDYYQQKEYYNNHLANLIKEKSRVFCSKLANV
jgi:hypothetical protein